MGEHDASVELVAMRDAGVLDDLISDLILVIAGEIVPAAWARLTEGHGRNPRRIKPVRCGAKTRRAGPSLRFGNGMWSWSVRTST